MQYHIQTTPIWDAFKEPCDCPVCKLYERVENRLLKQYLEEAVMEPDYRVKVNKRGFCSNHLRKLYTGGNKLGLALQVHTRTDNIIAHIPTVSNARAAKRLADKLEKGLETCVICDEADEVMERYAYTIAEMYANEPEFPALFDKTNGFCLPHFILLLRYVNHAGKKAEAYVKSLCRRQTDGMRKLTNELERFTRRFDYRSTDKVAHGNNDALSRAINKIKGNIVKD